MKTTTNVFLDGIITDQNALTVPQTALTSALNATILTGNGNEGLLLNDMGNTLIKDSITGNVMSLNDGFIPLGMKEHGGVLYIASYNPETKEGELGSIPSPVIHYTYESEDPITNDITITDLSEKSDTLEPKINTNVIYLSDRTFHAGDKFIPVLNILNLTELYSREYLVGTNQYVKEEYPYVSTIDKKGWYKVKLYAITDNGKEVYLENICNNHQLYILRDGVKYTSDYWFILYDEKLTLDEEACKNSNLYRTFPNIRAGKLAIKFEPELHDSIQYTRNASYELNIPSIYIDNTSDKNVYVVINGLKYTGNCPVLPDKIQIIYNGDENSQRIYTYNNGTFTLHNSEFHSEFKIGRSKELKVTKNQDTFFISKDLFIDDDDNLNIINYSTESLEHSLCAIKIDSFNTNIDILIKLFVKDNNEKYIEYRTDILPRFNPAVIEFGTSDAECIFSQLYYDPDCTHGETWDIPLFNSFGTYAKSLFIYKDTDDEKHILQYNSSSKKYEPISDINSEVQHTVDTYTEMKTWIYPLYFMKCSDGGNVPDNNRYPRACLLPQIMSYIDNENYGFESFVQYPAFVLCSELPLVKIVKNNITTYRPLLLPVTFEEPKPSSKLVSELVEQQQNYFSLHKNNFGYTPGDLINHYLYSVNLSSVNDGIFLTPSDFSTSELIYHGHPLSKPLPTGFETFFDRRLNKDYTLACYVTDSNEQETIIDENHLGLTHFLPKTIVQGNDLFWYYRFNFDWGLKGSNPYLSLKDWKKIGLENVLLKQCPGYLSEEKSSDVNFSLFNYSHSLDYLYKDNITFRINNFGDRHISYFKLIAQESNGYWGLYKQEDYFTLKHSLTINNEYKEDKITDKISTIGEDIYYTKIEPKSQLCLFNGMSFDITPDKNKYNISYKMEIIDEKLNVQSRQLVVTPLLFLEIDDSITRNYKADYKIATQINFGNAGFYEYEPNKFIKVKTNVLTETNYLLDTLPEEIEDETLNLYRTPYSLFTPRQMSYDNSFTNTYGYFKIAPNELTYHLLLDKNVNLDEKSIYVLHINHSKWIDYRTSNLLFTITVKKNGSALGSYSFEGDTMVFYVQDSGLYTISIDYQNKDALGGYYIKNLGLYAVDSTESSWVNINDGYKYSDLLNKARNNLLYFFTQEESKGVILPVVICYKEEYEDSSKPGCLLKGFQGFLALPAHAYQKYIGRYRISTNRTCVLDTQVYDATSDLLQGVNGIKIQEEISNE